MTNLEVTLSVLVAVLSGWAILASAYARLGWERARWWQAEAERCLELAERLDAKLEQRERS